MNEHEKAAKAAQMVEAMTGFYIHLVILRPGDGVAARWSTCSRRRTCGGCSGCSSAGASASSLHWLAVFGSRPSFITTWQLRKIKEMKDRM